MPDSGPTPPPAPSTPRSTPVRRSPRTAWGPARRLQYARTGNPTRQALEASLAAVEDGTYGRAFSSGMAATDCALRAVLRPGDHIVIPDDAYGGTFRLIDKVFTHWGVTHTPVALGDLDAVRAACTPATKLIWVETPTNPLLSIADIAGIVELAAEVKARVLVDNTFASPALQQPLTLGADIVLHSTTKYIGGHSDVVGGALVTNDEELTPRSRSCRTVPAPCPVPSTRT